MGRVSMATRDDLVTALSARYGASPRSERGRILDEFVAVTGVHRKHAMKLLRAGRASRGIGPRLGRRLYDTAMREALVVLWEASDRICGKRLRPMIPILLEAMERHGHLCPASEIRAGLLAMSAATIDRSLREVRDLAGGRTRRRTAPSAALRRSIPVRTFADWHDPAPGFIEADLVAHSGPTSRGSFIQTLTLTDIATGWTACAPVLVREQRLLTEVLGAMRKLMPFPMLGFDTDNDSVFMNETVKAYCADAAITFTRCRPSKKNDQAFVEQKNGAVVRRIVGYRRFEGLDAAAALARLYRSVRLFVNLFQPSFKLAEKTREGALVRKRYPLPATPAQRLLSDPRTSAATRRRVEALCRDADPIRLLSEIRTAQHDLVALADCPMEGKATAPTSSNLETVLSGLRTAWQEGEVRPTARLKPTPKRLRRRPDPFASVTMQMKDWFEAEPWRTSREFFERLQAEHPDTDPAGQLRTLQRRLKDWRREAATQLVVGVRSPDAAHLLGPSIAVNPMIPREHSGEANLQSLGSSLE